MIIDAVGNIFRGQKHQISELLFVHVSVITLLWWLNLFLTLRHDFFKFLNFKFYFWNSQVCVSYAQP